jgi:twitching motility protein PilT
MNIAALQPGSQTSADQKKLSAFSFTDLLISTGEVRVTPLVKGLKPHGVIGFDGEKGMVPMPPALLQDVAEFSNVLHAKWIELNCQREFRLQYDGSGYRCSIIEAPEGSISRPTTNARTQNWCIRHIASQVPEFERLGFMPDIVSTMKALKTARGLVLVSGSFGSGKSTTASSLFKNWVNAEREIGVTLEDPPEFDLAGVTDDAGAIYQVDMTDKSMAQAIKAARRWAPRYLFLGEVRTPDAAYEMMHMAISGPLVICTIHASDPIKAIMSLIQFCSGAMSEQSARETVATSLVSVVWQEINAGRLNPSMATIHGPENFGIRKKIELGQFQSIYEDLERQKVNRGRAEGSRFGNGLR